jgi:hypothetical protein
MKFKNHELLILVIFDSHSAEFKIIVNKKFKKIRIEIYQFLQ